MIINHISDLIKYKLVHLIDFGDNTVDNIMYLIIMYVVSWLLSYTNYELYFHTLVLRRSPNIIYNPKDYKMSSHTFNMILNSSMNADEITQIFNWIHNSCILDVTTKCNSKCVTLNSFMNDKQIQILYNYRNKPIYKLDDDVMYMSIDDDDYGCGDDYKLLIRFNYVKTWDHFCKTINFTSKITNVNNTETKKIFIIMSMV